MVFYPKVVEKRREHFRDQWSWRIENILVSVILGKMCVIMLVHTIIVGGAGLHAKWEHDAEHRKRTTFYASH